jgi:hypothetical protein
MQDLSSDRRESARHSGASRTRSQPRLLRRVAPWLIAAVVMLVSVYMIVSYRQRGELLSDAVIEQVGLLTSVVGLSAEDLLAEGRTTELDQLLRTVLSSDEVFAAIVFRATDVFAGDAVELPCLRPELPANTPTARVSGYAECGAGVHWSARPLTSAPYWLVVAAQEIVLHERSRIRRQERAGRPSPYQNARPMNSRVRTGAPHSHPIHRVRG